MTAQRESQIVTFKADPALVDAMKGIRNRSEFIRAAILSALDSACPLCAGTGVLTANQMRHWNEFTESHALEMCDDCNEVRMVCAVD
jgi:hypothetical protein